MASCRASTSLQCSLYLIWRNLAIGVTLSLCYGFSHKSIQPIIMTSLRASTSLLYTMASPAGVPALLTSCHSKYQLFISYGFSRRSTSQFDFSPQQVPVVRMIVASLLRVPACYCDLLLCEFQSFNPTSRCGSSSLSIRPLAVQVPVFQSDLSLCEFQSFNPTSRCASSSRLI